MKREGERRLFCRKRERRWERRIGKEGEGEEGEGEGGEGSCVVREGNFWDKIFQIKGGREGEEGEEGEGGGMVKSQKDPDNQQRCPTTLSISCNNPPTTPSPFLPPLLFFPRLPLSSFSFHHPNNSLSKRHPSFSPPHLHPPSPSLPSPSPPLSCEGGEGGGREERRATREEKIFWVDWKWCCSVS